MKKRLRQMLGQIRLWSSRMGIDIPMFIQSVRALPEYYSDLATLKKQQAASPAPFELALPFPCLQDKYSQAGSASGHYFFQDLLVAQSIFANNPKLHVDIGSRVDGFVAHVASFRVIEVLDIRPVTVALPNFRFTQADLMAQLDPKLVDYCDSLSCLHALEHFGLGRYGDPIDVHGHEKGFENLYRILKQGGKFYFSVPMGTQRINFNAHRVFAMTTLLGMLEGRYQIDRFSYVSDGGNLVLDAEMTPDKIKNNYGCNWGCAIFELTKL